MSRRTVEELVEVITAEQVFETWLTALERLGLPARSWRRIGVARSIMQVVAQSYAGVMLVMVAAIKGGFLDDATGPWLTRLAFSAFAVVRPSATFATGKVTITNTGGGVFSFAADELVVTWEAGKKAYRNAAPFTLNPGDSFEIDIVARESGASSSAPPGTVTKAEQVLPGVTITNAVSIIGSDEMTDADLRQLCRDKLASLSLRGPRGAYAYAVQSATRIDGSPVDINRRSISEYSSTGQVTIYVASPTGVPAATDLTAIRARIEAVARPDTVTTTVAAATSVAFSRSLVVWARADVGLEAESVRQLCLAQIVGLQRDWPISGYKKPPSTQGYLYAGELESRVQAGHPAIFAVDGSGADMPLNAGEIAAISVSVDVRLVQVPG